MTRDYPSDWNSRRKKVYRRDNHTCQNCGASGESVELHAHHIVPKSKGGSHELSNLKALCSECHKAIHGDSMAPTAKEDSSRASSPSISSNPTIDISHEQIDIITEAVIQLTFIIISVVVAFIAQLSYTLISGTNAPNIFFWIATVSSSILLRENVLMGLGQDEKTLINHQSINKNIYGVLSLLLSMFTLILLSGSTYNYQ